MKAVFAMQRKIIKILELSFIALLVAGAIWLINQVGIELRINVARFGYLDTIYHYVAQTL